MRDERQKNSARASNFPTPLVLLLLIESVTLVVWDVVLTTLLVGVVVVDESVDVVVDVLLVLVLEV